MLILVRLLAICQLQLLFAGISSVSSGDDNLLGLLRDAQQSNLGRYPHGELRATVERGQEGVVASVKKVDAHLLWDDSNSRISCVVEETSGRVGEAAYRRATDKLEIIINDLNYTVYSDATNTLSTWPLLKQEPYSLSRLRPVDFWYGRDDGQGADWLYYLNPKLKSPHQPDRVVALAIRRIDENRVEVERKIEGETRVRMVFSLRDDGNVTESESVDSKIDWSESRKYLWKRDVKHRLYMKELIIKSKRTINGESIALMSKYEITQFDPDATPSRSAFFKSSLPVKPRAMVADEAAGLRYRHGDRPRADVTRSFDSLIEVMREEGFAGKRRGR